QRLEDLRAENIRLTSQLESSLSEARRQAEMQRDKNVAKERAAQARIVDLETQLSRATASAASMKRAKDEAERRFNSKLHDMKDRLEQANTNDGICSEDVVKTMNKFGRILEKGYPNLYTDVVRQLNFRINFEIVICGLFTSVSDNILMGGITWAKIVSMHAFAGALAKDCCQAKDIKTARNISKWMGQYTRKRLSGWIRRHGGWDGFVVHFDNGSLFRPGGRRKWFERTAIVVAGLAAVTAVCAIILHSS
ncbi:hypothetical protein QZH41_002828, partial [Actinostola sp. cb2023]